MTLHRGFDFRRGAWLLAVSIFLVTSCGGGKDAGCDGATRGCVLLENTMTQEWTVSVVGGGKAVVPAGIPSNPGHAWITVNSSEGSEVTFFIAPLNPGRATCIVVPSTWSNPAIPPQVNIYGSGSLNCYHW